MNTKPFDRLLRLAILILVALAAPRAIAEDQWRLEAERWYMVEMLGERAGWLRDTIWRDDEHYRSTAHMRMSISRGPEPVTIETRFTTVETIDGKPVSMRLVQKMGVDSVDTEWRFEPRHLSERTLHGDQVIEKQRPLPEPGWLTPMGIRRLVASSLETGIETIEYKELNPQERLKTVTTTMTRVGEGSYKIGDETIPVSTWTKRSDIMPLAAREWYAEDGTLVYQALDFGLGTMATSLCTKAEALAAGDGKVPELLLATFVKPDKPIRDPLGATKAKLRLRVRSGDMPELPSAGAQRVEFDDDGDEAIVIIDLARGGLADGVDRDLYLERSANTDTEDPAILALVEKARSRAGDAPIERADAMRALVHETVKSKNLDTAFGTASETARTRSGDCSEHAVLLCAMLRADGIPARVAIGLVYADRFMGERDIFGWHMWTQALIDGRWVDLDATLPRRYHAGHVLTGTTALADGGLGAELASTVMLLGNLEIEVLDVGYE